MAGDPGNLSARGPPLRPEEHPGQLDSHVPVTVDQSYAGVLQQPASFIGGGPGDQEKARLTRDLAGIVGELPGGSSVGHPLYLDLYHVGDVAGTDEDVGPPPPRQGRLHFHGDSGDLLEDAGRFLLQGALDIYNRMVLHNDSKYSSFCKTRQLARTP